MSENGRKAIDTIVKQHVEFARKNGKEVTDAEARKFVTQVAERSDKKVKKNK